MFVSGRVYMINDRERNILKMQDQIEEMSRLLLSDWQALELHAVEEEIFRTLLRVGNNALAAFVEKKGTGENAYGDEIHSHSEKNWTYISIFGDVAIKRAYFWDKEKGNGVFPIDEELNLASKHYSYLLQNWNQLSDDPTPPGGHAQRRYSNKYFPTCAGLPAQSTDDDRIVRYYSMLNDRIVTYILA